MKTKKLHPIKPHRVAHSTLKTATPQNDWDVANSLNALELYSLDKRGKSITPDEGREVTDAPKVLGNLLSKRGSHLKGP